MAYSRIKQHQEEIAFFCTHPPASQCSDPWAATLRYMIYHSTISSFLPITMDLILCYAYLVLEFVIHWHTFMRN